MKNFDFQISPEISALSLPEPILTIFGLTSACVCVCVCVCGCADVLILYNSKTVDRRIMKFCI
ncbi:hypothetical protein O3M35_007183 [Rhynocoris fuscipes]|uniref:Uncharacterized protein n=1 Tax=Rhynocoris fuscipes TaxID=488301 RepID=A0AAW1D9A4_9HEMI